MPRLSESDKELMERVEALACAHRLMMLIADDGTVLVAEQWEDESGDVRIHPMLRKITDEEASKLRFQGKPLVSRVVDLSTGEKRDLRPSGCDED